MIPFLLNSGRSCVRNKRLAVVFAFVSVLCPARAETLQTGQPQITLESVGTRYGISAFGHTSHFRELDAFVEWNLPYQWELGRDFSLSTKVSASGGWLDRLGDSGAIFSGGPELVVKQKGFPIFLEGGVVPALLTRGRFGSVKIGGDIQFISHAALNYDFTPHLRVFYRFQHMSNGGLEHPNPGVNLHLFGASYLF
jgi:hypothetical protein